MGDIDTQAPALGIDYTSRQDLSETFRQADTTVLQLMHATIASPIFVLSAARVETKTCQDAGIFVNGKL